MNLVMSKAEAAFGATPFGKSVEKIINLIDNEMFPKVLEGHKADQEELNQLAAALAKCGKTKNVMVMKCLPQTRTCKRTCEQSTALGPCAMGHVWFDCWVVLIVACPS